MSQDQGQTLKEIIEQQAQEQGMVNQLLSHEEAKECSHAKGYINQRVFGCKTCAPEGQFGCCLGCFLECHLEHDTFEVGVKRAFRCDCAASCHLAQQQSRETNHQNQYDLNFQNKFCRCRSQYQPDEFMVGCAGCLDFYHTYHLGLNEQEQQIVENNENLNQMLCPSCVINKYPVMLHYLNDPSVVLPLLSLPQDLSSQQEHVITSDSLKRPLSKLYESDCLIKKDYRPEPISKHYDNKPLFLPTNFQEGMCQCRDCQKLYKDLEMKELTGLLVDNGAILEEEFFQQLDQEGRDKGLLDIEDNERQLREYMSKYDHVTQCEIAYKYNSLKEKVTRYIDSLDQSGPISEEQLRPLFDELQGIKHRKRE